MRHLLVGLCALALCSTVAGQEVLPGPGCSSGPPTEIVIPGSGYSSYSLVFPPGFGYSSYSLVFPPGFGYSAYGRIIPTPGHDCPGPLPIVPLVTTPPATPAAPPER